LSSALARLVVFTTSASVLVIEILAMRLLAPYLGISLGVFTGVIGVILAGIALGAWIGGRLADRADPRLFIGPAMVTGGAMAIVSPLLVDWVGPNLSNDPGSILVATIVAFLLPAILLSTVHPLVVKVRLETLDETGRVVGTYSAVGTAGAIFGTFLTGFFLVASLPSRPIIVAVGLLLAVAGFLLWGVGRRWARVATVVGALVLGAWTLSDRGPCQVETAYHCASIIEDSNRPTGRILVLDRLYNSYVDLQDPTHLEFRYISLMADLVDGVLPEGPIDIVAIGGGGMTLPGFYAATRPGEVNYALEIDGAVADLARNELALSDDVDVVVGDARISLRSVPDGSARVVVGDAFSGASVPWHLTTVEYMAEIKRVMTADGLYLMNVIDFRGLHFARATAATLSTVFADVAMLVPPSYLAGDSGGNFVFVASSQPLDPNILATVANTRGHGEAVYQWASLAEFASGAIVLRDDFAPVDQILGRS
jgi:spermidine synthase